MRKLQTEQKQTNTMRKHTLLFTGAIEAVVGILLLLNPVEFTSGILIILGIALIVFGIVQLVQYFRLDPPQAAAGSLLTQGLLLLLAGAFCAFHSSWFLETFPVLATLYGAAILVVGVGKIQFAADRFRLHAAGWKGAALSAAASILCAAVLIGNPFPTTAALWLFAGIALLVLGGFDLFLSLYRPKTP